MPLAALAEPEALVRAVARAAGCAPGDLPPHAVRRRSLDARRGGVRFRYVVELGPAPAGELGEPPPREVTRPEEVLVVGDGPAGLFAAYELARHGVGCTVLDRGKPVRPRRVDLRGLTRLGVVDPDSNYCFGEGGAGTYSDGKLYTRAHKRGDVRDVLELLVAHGAPPDVLVDARPHVGSNRLPGVVTALRERLEGVGVRFSFGARVTDLMLEGGAVAGVELAGGVRLPARRVILATGHGARDVYELLLRRGALLEAKPFALGVRVEHPQPLIDRVQYGADAGHPALPAAAYRLAEQVEGRGVFSFCMCPGGFIVPASTEPDGLVVNGMSLSRRDSPFANSGLVVAVGPEHWEAAGHRGPLGGVAFQRAVERAARAAGGALLEAPAARITDFLAGRASSTLPRSSYRPGLVSAQLREVLDAGGVAISRCLAAALPAFSRALPGFVTEEGVLVGVESRTSAPVRVLRDASLQAPGLAGLFPAGEGAGYAGGIVSAALDGVRVARAVVASLGREPRASFVGAR